MDPRDFLATAGRLVSGIREVLRRRVSARLRDLALGGKRPRHEKTISCLKGAKDSAVRSLGKELDNLYSARLDADYQIERTVSRDRAVRELENAHDLVDDMDRLGETRLAENAEEYCRALEPPPK